MLWLQGTLGLEPQGVELQGTLGLEPQGVELQGTLGLEPQGVELQGTLGLVLLSNLKVQLLSRLEEEPLGMQEGVVSL